MNFWDPMISWAGGYAQFIWPAYGVSVLGLTGAVIWTLSAYRQAKARLKRLEEKKP